MRGGRRGDPFSQHRPTDFEDIPAGQTYMPSQMAASTPQSRQQLPPQVERGDGSMTPSSPLGRFDGRRRPSGGGQVSYPLLPPPPAPPAHHHHHHQAMSMPLHDPYYQQGYYEASPTSMDPNVSVSRFDGRPLGPSSAAARPGHPYGQGGHGYNHIPHGGEFYVDGRPPSRPGPDSPLMHHPHQPRSPLPLGGGGGRLVAANHYDLSPSSGRGDVSPAASHRRGKAPSLKADCIGGGDALWRRIKAWVSGTPDPNTKNGVCYYDDGAPSATAMLMTTHHEVPPLHKLAQGPPAAGYDNYEVSVMYDGRHPATVYGPPIRSMENPKMRPCCKMILVALAILLLVISLFATVTMFLKMHQHSFECESDTLDSRGGWSFEKKVWCCENKNVGCETDDSSDSRASMITVEKPDVMLATTRTYTTTTTTPFYPCDVLQVSSWDAGQQAWCCLHMNRGCPQTTTELPHDCEANLATWNTAWSAGKKDWCCRRERVGCPFEVPNPPELPPKPIGLGYNCASGWSNWEIGWSKEKKAWCCEFENLGCPYTTTTGLPASAHCDINCNIKGEDSSCRKRVHWVVEHRKRSCQESLRDVVAECEMCYRCSLASLQCEEPFDCHSNQNNMNQWSNEQKEFCCRSSGVSCGVIPYNCFDQSNPIDKWTEGKRVWCCEKEKLGCHRP